MNVAKKMLLKHILDDNYSYPIILSGMEKITLPACVFLPANIDERQLFTHSDWNKKLDFAAQNEKAYLLIKGLNKLMPAEQNKFCMLLKNRRAGNYKLPDNVGIIIPVVSKSELSPEILSLSLLWDVE